MKEAVIFDVDGVLIDSFAVQIKCYKEIARRLGIEEPSNDVVEKTFGLRLENKSKELFGLELGQISEHFEEIRTDLEKEMKPMEGLEDFLKDLKTKKAIATSKSRASLEKSFSDFLGFFDVIVTKGDTENLKPNPDPLLLACNKSR